LTENDRAVRAAVTRPSPDLRTDLGCRRRSIPSPCRRARQGPQGDAITFAHPATGNRTCAGAQGRLNLFSERAAVPPL